MTHDVMISLAELQGGEIVEVEITGLVGNTFMAELRLKLNDKVEVLSIRPSDAIAVAIRAQVPLGVSADLLDFAGTDLEDEFDETEAQTQLQVEDIDEGALISELRDFLESVNPEDFKP